MIASVTVSRADVDDGSSRLDIRSQLDDVKRITHVVSERLTVASGKASLVGQRRDREAVLSQQLNALLLTVLSQLRIPNSDG